MGTDQPFGTEGICLGGMLQQSRQKCAAGTENQKGCGRPETKSKIASLLGVHTGLPGNIYCVQSILSCLF